MGSKDDREMFQNWAGVSKKLNKRKITSRDSFTLAELVAVVIIVSLLAAIVTQQVIRTIKKGRDSRRIADINMIADALRAYYLDYGQYPGNTDNDHSGWDCSHDGVFIQPLLSGGYLSKTPLDPLNKNTGGVTSHIIPNNAYFYSYYRYPSGAGGWVPSALGPWVIVGARSFEVLTPNPFNTKSISGVTRNWGSEFDYYVILFEK